MTLAALSAGIVLTAAVGASLRFLVSERLNGHFPYGTLLVNVAAGFALGALSRLDEPWSVLVGVGAVGAFSTWATAANEIAELARSDEGGIALLYLAATVTLGVMAAWIGLQVA